MENMSVAQTVVSSANSIKDVLAFNYASQALNNSFFFDNLVCIWIPPSSTVVLKNIIAPTRRVTTTTYLVPFLQNPDVARTYDVLPPQRTRYFILWLSFATQILHVCCCAWYDVLGLGLAGLRRKRLASCLSRDIWPRDHACSQ